MAVGLIEGGERLCRRRTRGRHRPLERARHPAGWRLVSCEGITLNEALLGAADPEAALEFFEEFVYLLQPVIDPLCGSGKRGIVPPVSHCQIMPKLWEGH